MEEMQSELASACRKHQLAIQLCTALESCNAPAALAEARKAREESHEAVASILRRMAQ